MAAEYEAYVNPPYEISFRDPEGFDKDRGDHMLVIGRGNLDSVFVLSDDDLKMLFRVTAHRIHEKIHVGA